MDSKRTGFNRITFSLSLIMFLSSLVFLFIRAGTDNEGRMNTDTKIKGKYVITPVDLPDELDFAGEAVPLDNFDVRESLDRELMVNTYWHSHTLLLIKRANRFFPVIEKILEENGLPDDLKYIAVAESDLENLISPANAVGYWQFLEGTAREFGLEVNDEVDERYHMEKATWAAGKYLMDSYQKYGNWTMAAASYNAGRRGVDRQMERQGADYYYDLLLNSETGRYIYRILALKLILSDPEKYGFVVKQEDLYPVIPSYEVTIDTPVEDFALWAARYSINYKILKYFNPWLREAYLTDLRGKSYYVKIPESGYRNFTMSADLPD